MKQDLLSLPSNNLYYLEQLYLLYLENPNQIDQSWREIFESFQENKSDLLKDLFGASWNPRRFTVESEDIGAHDASKQSKDNKKSSKSDLTLEQIHLLSAKERLIDAYRRFGHLSAQLDPLKLTEPLAHPELNMSLIGIQEEDLHKPLQRFGNEEFTTLASLKDRLKKIYAETIGAEIEHITNYNERIWLREKFETTSRQLSVEKKKRVYESLAAAEDFERFLQVKFPSAKRFGLEGGESLIAALQALVSQSASDNVQEVVFGMAHRGRLNVIVNIIKHHARRLLAEFQGNHGDLATQIGSGDVKYHLGVSNDQIIEGRPVHLSLMPNPSHLEFVNPVVAGKVRARQMMLNDQEHKHVLGVMIHGDAAFAGQGVVAETFLLANLEGYKTGGTIHFIINNQIGFTASPHMLKSSNYCSDFAKTIDAPIFHVNGDDPEAVIWITELACAYRQAFGKDVVIDLVCYRKNGHNEMDEPAFTQPLMYQKIRSHLSVRKHYADQLQADGVVDADWINLVDSNYAQYLKTEMEASTSFKFGEPDWLKGHWSGIDYKNDELEPMTGMSMEQLDRVGAALVVEPDDFEMNPKIKRLINDRKEMLYTTKAVDWAVGEALAFGSLLNEGVPVRLSGQDCRRGTFTQRHAVYTDQSTQQTLTPLNTISDDQAFFDVLNSPLSETAVLGFELGYSYADPRRLVIWEAQFGDFSNGAQVIIDQFISSCEAKWHRLTGLVLMLPHSFDGQGPEHSSARLERYLQLCAEDNMRVANCSTPANLFHILRRQIHSRTRKPLILMTPKALLRHKRVISPLKDFLSPSYFQPVLTEADPEIKPKNVKRVILCSGKVYYDLIEQREVLKRTNVALLRLEQFYPFPKESLIEALKVYEGAELIWCQEEPENMGAWNFVDRRLEETLKGLSYSSPRPLFIGRKPAASPATGFAEQHQHEQQELILKALTL